jgi:hypothetical protein
MGLPIQPLHTTLSTAKQLRELHHRRLTDYAKVGFNGDLEHAVNHLISMHRQKENVAILISEMIGANHNEYRQQLKRLGECDEFIR